MALTPWESKKNILRQVAFALIVAASRLEVGLVIGWSAVLPKLKVDNSTRFSVSDQDVTWLVSLPGVSGLAMTLAIGPLIEFTGPTRLLKTLVFLAGILWLLQAFTPYLSLLYLGRLGSCLIFNVVGPLAPSLISELVEPAVRGSLVAVVEAVVALGQLAVYVMADALPWRLTTALCAAPFFVVFVLAFFVPESPYWLLRQDRTEAATKALERLRGSVKDVGAELQEIETSIKERPQATLVDQLRQLSVAQNFRPVLFLASVFMLRELGGQYVVFSYTVYLFRQAGVAMDAFTCTILVGVVRLVCTVLGSLLLDRVGRRPMILMTSVVCGVSQLVGGVFLLAQFPGASWVPLAAVLVFVSSYGLGLSPIPWVLLGEILPTAVRSVGSSICVFNFALTIFVVSYTFPPLVARAGVGTALIVFAGFHAVLSGVVWAFLPETRGKSLTDLKDAFCSEAKGTGGAAAGETAQEGNVKDSNV
ncbi:facilitated trehalose transporter Tret1-like [Penaeus japonicus]|uniref:facilitated trehalose transporter Tret1-like n=1 Tax=Penaeus japonicus TaxID=27405 RepID=UPI001C70E9DD|nr:facilitated trehalose transporter Tret1-like [Penaeus japonicus]